MAFGPPSVPSGETSFHFGHLPIGDGRWQGFKSAPRAERRGTTGMSRDRYQRRGSEACGWLRLEQTDPGDGHAGSGIRPPSLVHGRGKPPGTRR